MPTGYLQEKFESVPGNETNTPTLSTKIMYPVLTEYTYDPGTNPMERNDELRATNEPLAVVPEAYRPTWSIAGRMYPDHIGWRLTHILGPPTTTAGDGIITDPDSTVLPANTYRHVWKSTDATWGGTSGASPLTAQHIAAYKDQGVYVKLKGAACETLTVNTPETGGARITANGPALYADDALSNPSLTPAYESLATRPFERSGLTLPTWLSGSGTHEDFGFTITNPVDAVASLGGASKWPDVMEKGEGIVTITGALAQRQLDPDDLAALRASTGFAVKAKWLSDTTITGSTKNALWLEGVNAQYVSGAPQALANVRRIGADFNFVLTTAGTGVAATITLVNGITSYT